MPKFTTKDTTGWLDNYNLPVTDHPETKPNIIPFLIDPLTNQPATPIRKAILLNNTPTQGKFTKTKDRSTAENIKNIALVPAVGVGIGLNQNKKKFGGTINNNWLNKY